jgi:hypothetical protein
MSDAPLFPRTLVGGLSLPRLVIGSNWFLGYSHTSVAKDKFLKEYQTRDRIAAVLAAFVELGIDAVMGPALHHLDEAVREAEQRAGRPILRVYTPWFELNPAGEALANAARAFDECAAMRAAFCLPHQSVTDALVDKRAGIIRDIDQYTRLIRERGMLPGLSTHMPETVVYTDKAGADVETYIQIYNAAGFLMTLEADWALRVITQARRPVITIKPLAAGRLLPLVGLAFVWSTLRDQDLVTIGTTTPDEAREVVELSLDLLSRRAPDNPLQATRSKKSVAST